MAKRPHDRLFRSSSLLVVTLGCLSWTSAALAQPGLAAPGTQGGDSVFVPAPRELTRPNELAWRALEAGRTAEAVDRFGEVLFAEQTENYFVESSEIPGHWLNLRVHQQQLLDSLPADARELFELKYGIEAQKILDEAIQDRDWETITRISQDYLHCKAGYSAAMLVGRRQLDQGRTMAAARQFQKILASDIGRQMWTPEVQLLAATALLASGRDGEVDQALSTLPDDWQASVGASLLSGQGSDATPTGATGQIAVRDWLLERIGSVPALALAAERNWAMFRGNAQRNGVSSAGYPLLINYWRVPTLLKASDRDVAVKFKRRLIDEGRSSAPAVNALAIGDYVVMRTPEFLVGVEMKTGLRTFYYPWDTADALVDASSTQGPQIAAPREAQLQERLWMDGIHGQMSSDGRSVFFVDDLGFRLSDPQRNRLAIARGLAVETPPNRLVSLRLYDDDNQPTEGKMSWIIGGVDGSDQPWSSGVFFLGPPLPADGMLYVLGEKSGEVRLFALEPSSAELSWSAQVAVTGIGGVEGSLIRRVGGASPSLFDTLLICPTSTGAVVAIDLVSRSAIWGYQYKPVETNRGIAGMQSWRPGDRWADSGILLVNGMAIVTPVEHNELIGLDLATGKPAWKIPRGDSAYVAGSDQGILVVAGWTSVRGLDVMTGEVRWETPLSEHGAPSGRGYLSEGRFYLPTTHRQVLGIAITDGLIADAVDTEYVLGNLICHRGKVISHDIDWVAAFHQDESNRRLVADALAVNPDDRNALLLQSQLQVRDKQWREAITSVERAKAIDPNSLEIDAALVEIVMLAARNDANLSVEVLEAHEPRILESEYRTEYLLRKTEQRASQQDLDGMVYALLAMIDTPPAGDLETPAVLLRRDVREFAPEVWAESLLSRPLQSGQVPSADAIAAIDAARATAFTNSDLHQMQQLDLLFGEVSPAPYYQLQLATTLLEANEPLAAEAVLEPLLSHADRVVQATATSNLIDLLATRGFAAQVPALAAKLIESFADITLPDGRNAGEVGLRWQNEMAARTVAAAWGTGRFEIRDSNRTDPQTQLSYPVVLESIAGDLAPRNLRFSHQSSVIRIDDERGNLLASVSVAEGAGWMARSSSNFQLLNHLLILDVTFANLGTELIAIDLFKAIAGDAQPIVWRHRLWGDTSRMIGFNPSNPQMRPESRLAGLGLSVIRNTFDNKVIGAYSNASSDGIVALRDDTATCIDPWTGNVLWKRHEIEPGGRAIIANDRLFAIGPDERSVSEFALGDATELPGREIDDIGVVFAKVDTTLCGIVTTSDAFQVTGRSLATGDEVWSMQIPAASRATRLDGNRLAVLQPEGLFRILDLASGNVEFESQVKPEAAIAAIQVYEDEYGVLLIASRNSSAGRQSSRTNANIDLMSVSNQPLVDGLAYSFNREGEAMWPGEVVIEQYCVMGSEIGKAPVLVLTRQYQAMQQGQPIGLMDLVLIDRRDGRMLWDESGIPTKPMNWSVTFDAETNIIRVSGPKQFELTPTDTPQPPSPAARTGASASGVRPRPPSVRRIFNGLGRAFDLAL